MSDEVDEELLLVATLGVALRMIRQRLDDVSVERVVRYSLNRAGISISTQLHIGPSPWPAAAIEQKASEP